MKISSLKAAFLAALLFVPIASRLRASGDPPTPPTPPAAPAAPVPPAPPEPPAPPPKKRHKKIVATEPERRIVVDGDGVRVWHDGEDPEIDLDADAFDDDGDDDDDRPTIVHVQRYGGGSYVGVRPIEMTPELREHFGAPKDAGVLVGDVEADSPAARAGLQVGDIVTRVNGARIESPVELQHEVRREKPGTSVRIEIVRNRTPKTVSVTVGKRPGDGTHVGELGPMRGFHIHGPGRPGTWGPPPGDFGALEEKLNELEKRLEELEGRLPAR